MCNIYLDQNITFTGVLLDITSPTKCAESPATQSVLKSPVKQAVIKSSTKFQNFNEMLLCSKTSPRSAYVMYGFKNAKMKKG